MKRCPAFRGGPPPGSLESGLPGSGHLGHDSLILILQRLELVRWNAPNRLKQWMSSTVWK